MPENTTAAGAAERPRRGLLWTVIGVVGELLLTAGVIALLFVAWQLWISDWIGAAEKNAAGNELSQEWAQQYGEPSIAPLPTAFASAAPKPDVTAAPVVLPPAKDAQIFGVLRVPRFGSDYAMPIAGGITRERTLNPIGIGHYPDTPMPGAVGNVALAAHRLTHGGAFHYLPSLHIGDPVVIETKDGWFVYRFRNLEYVRPSAVDVLLPVPQQPGAAANGRYLTLTTCGPIHFMSERVVAYAVFDHFTPRDAGPPSVLSERTP